LKKVLILLITFPILLSAQKQTYIKEYTYAADGKSEMSSRMGAVKGVKSALIEELVSTKIKVSLEQIQKIQNESMGIVRASILEEKYDGKEFWIKAKLYADPEKILERIKGPSVQKFYYKSAGDRYISVVDRDGFNGSVYKNHLTYITDGIRYANETKLPLTGVVEAYSDGKTVRQRTEFKDGLQDGATEYYNYKSGKIRDIWFFKEGVPKGVESFYENGKLYYKYSLKSKDNKHGWDKRYYKNGKLRYQKHYKNNALDGKSSTYDENGKILESTVYRNGKREGILTDYRVDGTVVSTKKYKDGLLHGRTTVYYQNGTVKVESTYDENTVTHVTKYARSGKVLSSRDY